MSSIEQLTADLKSAMINGEALRVSVLRMLKSELKNAEIALGHPLTEDEIINGIRKELKKRVDAVLMYEKGGDKERAESEKDEAVILESYLPAQLDTDIVEAYVTSLIKNIENPSIKNRGEVIKSTVEHFKNQTDGKTVSEIVSRLLP